MTTYLINQDRAQQFHEHQLDQKEQKSKLKKSAYKIKFQNICMNPQIIIKRNKILLANKKQLSRYEPKQINHKYNIYPLQKLANKTKSALSKHKETSNSKQLYKFDDMEQKKTQSARTYRHRSHQSSLNSSFCIQQQFQLKPNCQTFQIYPNKRQITQNYMRFILNKNKQEITKLNVCLKNTPATTYSGQIDQKLISQQKYFLKNGRKSSQFTRSRIRQRHTYSELRKARPSTTTSYFSPRKQNNYICQNKNQTQFQQIKPW